MTRQHLRPTLAITLIAATLMALAACGDSPTRPRPETPAYDPTSLTGGQFYRWTHGSTVRVWVLQPDDATRDVRSATTSAIAAWNAVPTSREFRLEAATSLANANVLILDRSTPLPVVAAASCPFEPRGSTGYTYFCPQGNRAQQLMTTVGGATLVSVVIRLDVGGMASQAILDAVVAHELGHAIGIGGHSPNPSDVMYGSPTIRIPTNRDSQTLQFLLGESPTFTL
ncbi:MAG: hypothetical protein IBJ03_12000 [Gemmatimonadaceae bacterium]|nr:hypothetical protein [Gemmatimonadaceae bacterium]